MMNRQEVFETWTRHKEQIEVPPDFPARVMARIRAGETTRRTWISLSAQWFARPWARAALIVVGASLGLARIVMTLQLILFV